MLCGRLMVLSLCAGRPSGCFLWLHVTRVRTFSPQSYSDYMEWWLSRCIFFCKTLQIVAFGRPNVSLFIYKGVFFLYDHAWGGAGCGISPVGTAFLSQSAVRCDGWRSALRRAMQCGAMADAARCVFCPDNLRPSACCISALGQISLWISPCCLLWWMKKCGL